MTDNEDITRINRNIKKLAKRIEQLKAEGPENGVADTLSRERFNQQRILLMLENVDDFGPHPFDLPTVLVKVYKRLGIGSGFN